MNEQFIYTGGEYREFRGYQFWGKRPVTILDKGALEAIQREPDFKPYQAKPEAEAPKPEVRPTINVKQVECPKCGRILGQGAAVHIKYCK